MTDPHSAETRAARWAGRDRPAMPRARSGRAAARGENRRQRSLRLATVVLVVIAGAFVLRYYQHTTTFDVFVDEFFYEDLGHSVRGGGFPRSGSPDIFFLHPPGFFYLEGAWEDVAGSAHGVLAEIYQVRVLNVVLAAISAGLVALIVARRSLFWAGAAGALFALDPYIIRQNGRVLLETATMTWALLGLLLLLPLFTSPRAHGSGRRACLGGLCLGLAVFTKDTGVMVTVLPLLAAALLLGRENRGWIRAALLCSAVPYTLFLVLVAVNGQIEPWWQAKVSGLARASGVQITTGFRRGGTPSLTATLQAQIADFGGTYLLLGLGVAAAVIVVRRGNREARYVALVYGGAALTVGYSGLFGTLEEQFLYLLIVMTIVVVGLAGTLLQRGHCGSAAPAPAPQEPALAEAGAPL